MIEYAIVMAAGRGLRLMPLTAQTSKALIPFHKSVLIADALDQIVHKIPVIGITVGHMGGELAKYAIDKGVSLILNTIGQQNAWWLFHTIVRHIDAPVLVLTCDNIVQLDLGWIESEYSKLGLPACMLVPVRPVEDIEGDYIFQNDNKVVKMTRTETNNLFASGIQLLNPKKINDAISRADDFNEVWSMLIKKKMLHCSSMYNKPWFSINTVDQLENFKKQFMIKNKLAIMLSDILNENITQDMLLAQTNLINDLGLNSLDMLRLIVEMEREFEITIELSTFNLKFFEAYQLLENYIERTQKNE